MTTTTCEFNSPRTWENIPPISKLEYWNYSQIICNSIDDKPEIFNLIQNPDTGGEFYIQKTLNYGEAMILWFLTLFSFYLIFKTAYNFFWKK